MLLVMSEPHQRLKQARLKAGYSSAGEFAMAHGFPAVTYRAHESGTRNFKVHSAQAYALALGLAAGQGWQWLMFGGSQSASAAAAPTPALSVGLHGADQPDSSDQQPSHLSDAVQGYRSFPPSTLQVPLYDVGVSAGGGASPFDAPAEGFLYFGAPQLAAITATPVECLAGVTVRGDSMEPTLKSGDHILVDLTINVPRSDGIFVLHFDEHLLIKRLCIDPVGKKASIVSDSPHYPNVEQCGLDDIRVLGRAIWLGRRL